MRVSEREREREKERGDERQQIKTEGGKRGQKIRIEDGRMSCSGVRLGKLRTENVRSSSGPFLALPFSEHTHSLYLPLSLIKDF